MPSHPETQCWMRGDLVKDIISEQQFIIEQLEHYITGGVR